jgi:hypothetical protein
MGLALQNEATMAIKDRDGRIVETPEEATQADNSPDTFVILIVSLAGAAVVGLALFWYFGVLPMPWDKTG